MLRRPSTRVTLAMSVVALALAGAALATVAVAPLLRASGEWHFPDHEVPAVHPQPPLAPILRVLMATTFVLLAAALAVALSGGSPRSRRRTIKVCALFGWLNAPACLALASACGGDVGGVVSGLVVGAVVGLFLATPFGVLYGVALSGAVEQLRRLRQRPSFAQQVEAQATVAVTVTSSAGIAVFLRGFAIGDVVPMAIPLAVLTAGALLYLHAEHRRGRVMRLMRDPEAHGYARVALADLAIDRQALWPLHGQVSEHADYALIERRGEVGAGGYRSADVRVPLALVD